MVEPTAGRDLEQGLDARTRWIDTIGIHDLAPERAVGIIVDRARGRRGGYVVTPNADYVVKAHRDPRFRDAVNGAIVRIADGMWIVYASLIAGRRIHRSATGRMLIPDLCRAAVANGLRVAFYGGADGVAAAAAARCIAETPGLDVGAAISPPTPLEIGSAEDLATVAALRASRADIVLVGLGAPRGALWMRAHTADLPGSVLIEIGAGIDLMAGRFRIAPSWMTATGFEWVFRLVQEPRRLARRYLLEDPWILWWALRQRFHR